MTRPYSLRELQDLENQIFLKYRIGDTFVLHVPCCHTYRVKRGGKKEAFLIENGPVLEDQTCSVCFKTRTTTIDPTEWMKTIQEYKNQPITLNYLTVLDQFYDWLYKHDFS